MTLPRVWPAGVGSMATSANGRPILRSRDLAVLDDNVQQAADKSPAASTINGPLFVKSTGSLSLETPGVTAEINGALAKARTDGGGRVESDDVPIFNSTRSFTVGMSILEAFGNPGGAINGTTSYGSIFPVTLPGTSIPVSWLWDAVEAVNHGFALKAQAAGGALVVPLTRLHDRATLTQLSVGFYVASARTSLPSLWYPACQVFRVDPFLGTIERLRASSDFAKFNDGGSPPNVAAYKNGGNANQLIYTPDQNNVIDVGRYFYFLALTDEDYANGADFASGANEFGAITTVHTADEDWFQ